MSPGIFLMFYSNIIAGKRKSMGIKKENNRSYNRNR
jgi:hypothetical protein